MACPVCCTDKSDAPTHRIKGRWRFFWGEHGDAGEVILEEGDIFNIPTGIFRGFENIGTDYGMIMAVLGTVQAGLLALDIEHGPGALDAAARVIAVG